MNTLRLRYVNDGIKKMEESNKVILKPEEYKHRWKELFNNTNPLHVEFGAGRGGFLIEMARRNPDINYLAFERNSKVIIKGLNIFQGEIPSNFYFAHSDARKGEDIFMPNSIDRIYLNFSDPWPKKRHTKRRLTYRRFLKLYEKLLIKMGEIHFKTDNDRLFEFSINEFEEMKWNITVVTRDLHNSIYNKGNIMTEYEEKFSSKGKNINKLIAVSPYQ